MAQRPHVQKLVERARPAGPLRAAVVYACDRDSLQLALSGAFAGYLEPTLVGPERRIRELADRSGLDISRLPIVDAADEARAAAQRAVELAREGHVAALIKGSLRNEDLLAPIAAPESGLRGDTRLSHACVLDLPGLPRPLVVADAQLNVAPNLAAKRDILLNTLQLTNAIGIAAPRVALLAAMDGPSQAFPSTTDAVALKSMATQGLFGTAIVEGPLTPDQALTRGDNGSEVSGRADVMIAPGMETAIILIRTLTGLTQGLAAGIVLGARIPVILPARTDALDARMASCVLASLLATAPLERASTSRPAAPAPQPSGTAGTDGRAIAA